MTAPVPPVGGPADPASPLQAALTDALAPLLPVEDCPVTALGHRGGVYWYIAAGGELRELHHDRHKRLGILSLFGGSSGWLAPRWPARDRDGNVKPGAFSEAAVASWLMRECHRAGLWDAATPQRGPGVWRDAEGLLVHAGDKLFVGGDWIDPGVRREDAIYPAYPRGQQPDFGAPAPPDVGLALLAGYKLWNYERESDADLMLGFDGAAMLGGAPDFRAHMMTVAPTGSGKTWLLNYKAAILGGAASVANDVSAAGIQQRLTGEARTVMLDEAEGSEAGQQKILGVIHLLRLMATGKGAQGWRGSAGGQSRAFSVTGCAYLSAILPPPMEPQDLNRITVVNMRPLRGDADLTRQQAKVEEAVALAAEQSAALRARAILAWPRFCEAVAVYRAGFLRRGLQPRHADRLSTLLAGRDILISNHPPTADQADEEAERFQDLVEEAEAQREDGEGEQCLTFLYSSPCDLWRSGDRETVAELIMQVLSSGDPATSPAAAVLGKIGIRVENGADDKHAHLLVAHRNTGLSKLFADSRWRGGAWRTALYQLGGGVTKAGKRFAGTLSRATVVPADFLPLLLDPQERRDQDERLGAVGA